MKLSEKIKELRENQSLSLMKLAKILNVSDASIFNWENGVEPKASHICALADYFQISADELLCRENYATGNIEIVGEKLSDKEKKLLDCFRSLNVDGQAAFITMAENIAAMYRRAEASKIS